MRISTTAIEAVRKYFEPGNDWMTESKLLAQLKGEEPETPARRHGIAFGQVLERPGKYWDRVRDGFCWPEAEIAAVTGEEQIFFPLAEMVAPLGLMDHERGQFEVKAVRPYAGHEVVTVADQIVGARIYEHKTCEAFDPDRYLESCQWRFLLDVLGGVSCTFLVFVIKLLDDGGIKLRGIEELTVYPYPALHEDCEMLVRQFVDFVTLRGLAPALEAHQLVRRGAL